MKAGNPNLACHVRSVQPVSEFFPEAVEKLTQMAGKGLRPVSLTVAGLDSAEVCNVPAIGETNPH